MGGEQSTPDITTHKKYYNLIDYGYCQVWQRKEDNKEHL